MVNYMEIVIALWLEGKDVAARRLENALSTESSNEIQNSMYLAFATALLAKNEDENAKQRRYWVDKSIGLLERFLIRGGNPSLIRVAPDLAILHSESTFLALVSTVPVEQYWIANCEVTRGAFESFITDDSYKDNKPISWQSNEESNALTVNTSRSIGRTPARSVSWYDAILYCNWLSKRENRKPAYRTASEEKVRDWNGREFEMHRWEEDKSSNGYRLPTEREWEYACRAGSSTNWSPGNDEEVLMNYCQIAPSKYTAICGSKLPNAWGLHEMHGNMAEWCWEYFDNSFSDRVLRGGSWAFLAANCRSEDRYHQSPVNREVILGFRLVLNSASEVNTRTENQNSERNNVEMRQQNPKQVPHLGNSPHAGISPPIE